MRILKRLILNILINGLILWLIVWLLDGVYFSPVIHTVRDEVRVLLFAGAVIGIINAVIKPILKILSFPLVIMTLGLFFLIIDMLILKMLTWVVPDLMIDGLQTLLISAILFSVFNTAEHLMFHKKK